MFVLLFARFGFGFLVLANALYVENPKPFLNENWFFLLMTFFFAITNGFTYGSTLNIASHSVKVIY